PLGFAGHWSDVARAAQSAMRGAWSNGRCRRGDRQQSAVPRRGQTLGFARGLSIPAAIDMGNGPAVNAARFKDRSAEEWRRQAVDALMSRQPDQVAVPLDEDVL